MIEKLTDSEVAALDAGKCPDCGEKNFYLGPQGGMNTNIECANQNCTARFNVVLGMAGGFGKHRNGRSLKAPNSIWVEVSRSISVWIGAIWRSNMAVVKAICWLMNLPAPFGERLQRPLERLTPNPKLKFMEQCREVMRTGGKG